MHVQCEGCLHVSQSSVNRLLAEAHYGRGGPEDFLKSPPTIKVFNKDNKNH